MMFNCQFVGLPMYLIFIELDFLEVKFSF